MVRTISTLMVLGFIASGCSGGGGSGGGGTTVVDNRDTVAPSVNVTASSLSVEGGETVAMTITANDAVDGALNATMTCDAGSVVGTLLVTSAVTADTTIKCTASATDKAGNTGTGTVNIAVKPATVSFVSATSATLMQGQFGGFFVHGLPLTASTYTGTIGNRTITLNRGSASELSWQVPADLAPGPYTLIVDVGSHKYSYAVTVTATPSVADPKSFLTDKINTAITAVDSFLAAEGSRMTPAQRMQFQGYRTTLVTALGDTVSMSAADANAAALVLRANSAANTAAGFKQALLSEQCKNALVDFRTTKALVIVEGLGGLALAVFTPDPSFIIKIGGLILYLDALRRLDTLASDVENVVNTCVDDKQTKLVSPNAQAAGKGSFASAVSADGGLGFTNRVAQDFRVYEIRRMNGDVIGEVDQSATELADLAAQSPYVPAALSNVLANLVTEKNRYVPSSEVSLDSVSDSNILGVKGGSGDIISLVFSYAGDPPSENIPFTFNLSISGQPQAFSAQLITALPGAEDAAVSLIQGKPVTSQLQVRGATSIELVQQPAHGAATIGIDGLLQYTPAGQYFGTDTIKFRARNANGVSRTATVLLTIARQFEGMWTVTSKSVTASQSQPGLCPNETETFTMPLSRASDTLYLATYEGVSMNVTMGSKDDPNGLVGQISGTYDDGPGETTESLTVNIPNSSQLNGNSTWSYAGPNGARCTGTTTITGIRP